MRSDESQFPSRLFGSEDKKKIIIMGKGISNY